MELFPRLDPERLQEINAEVGEGSAFHIQHGYYADALSPATLSLPAQWESRLVQMPLAGGVTAWFLDPNAAAASKLIRSAQSDLEWVDAGPHAGILSAERIATRVRSIENALAGEVPKALENLAAEAGGPSHSIGDKAGYSGRVPLDYHITRDTTARRVIAV